MPSYPANWTTLALEAAGIEPTLHAMTVMAAWAKSTPLPVLPNNPIGMPVTQATDIRYLSTRYRMFPSLNAFYASFASFLSTSQGQNIKHALTGQRGYGVAWRAISSLKWPASDTETDYPSAVLDMASASYRHSVNATPAAARRTSGTIGGSKEPAASAGQLNDTLQRYVNNTVRISRYSGYIP